MGAIGTYNSSYSMIAASNGGIVRTLQSVHRRAWCMEHDSNWFGHQRGFARDCNDLDTQKWILSGDTIKSFDNARCLENDIGWWTPGRIHVVACNGENNQKWKWNYGVTKIRSVHDDEKCLEVNLGDRWLSMNYCDYDGDNQKWDL